MYARRRELRVIYGLIIAAIFVYALWGLFYTGTRVPPRIERDSCVIGNAEVAPCPSASS